MIMPSGQIDTRMTTSSAVADQQHPEAGDLGAEGIPIT